MQHCGRRLHASTVQSTKYDSAKHLVDTFNRPGLTDEEKEYLKTVLCYIIMTFEKFPLKTETFVKEFAQIAGINDADVYSTAVNLLAHEVNKVEIIHNPHILQALIRSIWQNPSQPLSTQVLESLIDIVVLKIAANVESVSQFGELLATMAAANVSGVSKEKLDLLLKKFEHLKLEVEKDPNLDEATKTELKFRIDFASQASERIASDEPQTKTLQRKLNAFILGALQIGGVAGTLAATAITSGGVVTVLAIPAAILGILESRKNFIKAFAKSNKANWYESFLNLKLAILDKVTKKYKSLDDKEVSTLKEEFSYLIDNKLDYHTKFGIIDTLKFLIIAHKQDIIHTNCICVLIEYTKDPLLIRKVLDVFAELHLNERFKVKIENIVEELNLVEEFKERLNILQNKLLIVPPTDIKLNLISHGQQQADEAIGGKKETNGLIKAVFFEEGSVVIGCTFENDHVFLIPADITDEQKIYIQQMIDTVKETRASIVLGFVEKNVYLENNTIKDCDVSLVGSTKKKNWRWFSS